jgi:uncharacterized protein (TIGR02677 family)
MVSKANVSARSASNRSSGGVVVDNASRRSRPVGRRAGRSSAIGLFPRVTVTLSPRSIASSRSENRRAASVAVMVGMKPEISDYLIADGLAELAGLHRQPRSSAADARIHVQLAQVERHLSALVASVRQFNAHLQRLLREDATDDDVFADVKRRTVNYLEEHVEGVERPQRRLVHVVIELDSFGIATLFDRALAGANLAPVADGDPGPAWLAERERRWRALRVWFAPADASSPLVGGLVDVARTAIVELLRVLERRWDNRRRSASIAHDFRALARLVAAAPGDDEAHRLFAAAIRLWPARHAHLPPLDGSARAPQLSWLAADPVEVAPALRTTGTLANRGRVNPVADPTLLRARRQREQAEALAVHERLREALLTDGRVRLSAFGDLDGAAFAELLSLLAAGLDARLGSDRTRRALSPDGSVEVVLHDVRDGRAVETPPRPARFAVPTCSSRSRSPMPSSRAGRHPVPRSALDENLAGERSAAVRELLATPLLDAESDRDEFRLVVRHADWLTEYLEQACRWTLTFTPRPVSPASRSGLSRSIRVGRCAERGATASPSTGAATRCCFSSAPSWYATR